MIFFENFHFLRPLWLLLLPILLLVFLSKKNFWQKTKGAWQKVIDPHLLKFLLIKNENSTKKTVNKILPNLFLLSILLALSGPTFKKIQLPESLTKRPLVITLELSEHMLASDLEPNRLKRAEFKIRDLLEKHAGGVASLIVFAGDAHIVVPLTNDFATIISLLPSLKPAIMPIKGISLISAFKKIEEVLQNELSAKAIIITSTNFSDNLNSLPPTIGKNTDIAIWAFATKEGAPLPMSEGKFEKTSDGTTISKISNSSLATLRKKGFQIIESSFDNSDIEKLAQIKSEKLKKSGINYDEWEDLGIYLSILAAVLFIIMILTKNMAVICLLLIFFPHKLDAKNLSDLFLRQDQIAHRYLIAGEMEEAAKLAIDPMTRGAVFFRTQQYEKAMEEFSQVKTPDGFYNLGNALAHLNKIPEAINAYNEALALDPNHVDAKYNKELLEKNQQNKNKDQEQKEEKPDNKQEENKEDNAKQQQNEKADEPLDKNKEEDQPKEQKETSSEKHQEEQKESLKPKETKEGQKDSLDPNTTHYLNKLNSNDTLYFKRKFLYESLKEQKNGGK